MSINFENIFKKPEAQNLEFDFWYLLKNAPKHTAALVKWCGYPFVLLCGIGGISSLISVFIEYINEGYGLSIVRISIALINIGIALLIWVGSGWHGQKKEGLLDLNQAFKDEFDKSNKSRWNFDLFGSKEIKNLISKLSRGNKDIVHFKNVFSIKEKSRTWFIADIVRIEHTSTAAQGYREDISCIYIKTGFPNVKSKLILTKATEIEEWVKKYIDVDIHRLIKHIETLRVNNSGMILEFEKTIVNPQKKMTLVRFIDEHLNSSSSYQKAKMTKKDKSISKIELDTFDITLHTWDGYPGVIKELSYKTEEILFRFNSYSYVTDPMDVVSDSLNLGFSIEKRVNDEYVPLGSRIEISSWENYMHLENLDFPLSWECMCKKLVHLLINTYSELNIKHQTPPDIFYSNRLLELGNLSFNYQIGEWTESDLNQTNNLEQFYKKYFAQKK